MSKCEWDESKHPNQPHCPFHDDMGAEWDIRKEGDYYKIYKNDEPLQGEYTSKDEAEENLAYEIDSKGDNDYKKYADYLKNNLKNLETQYNEQQMFFDRKDDRFDMNKSIRLDKEIDALKREIKYFENPIESDDILEDLYEENFDDWNKKN